MSEQITTIDGTYPSTATMEGRGKATDNIVKELFAQGSRPLPGDAVASDPPLTDFRLDPKVAPIENIIDLKNQLVNQALTPLPGSQQKTSSGT